LFPRRMPVPRNHTACQRTSASAQPILLMDRHVAPRPSCKSATRASLRTCRFLRAQRSFRCYPAPLATPEDSTRQPTTHRLSALSCQPRTLNLTSGRGYRKNQPRQIESPRQS
jgi:hypothetical protein